jgi:hypothetical protein
VGRLVPNRLRQFEKEESVMKKLALMFVLVAVAVGLAVSAAACEDDEEDGDADAPTAAATDEGETPAGDSASETTVEVDMSEYLMSPDPTSAPAGSVTFNANNIGGAAHELHVIRTDLAPDALPTNADGSFDEEGEGVEEAGHIEEVEAMSAGSDTFELEAGAYVLICNLVDEAADGTMTSHYAEGMFSAFAVE